MGPPRLTHATPGSTLKVAVDFFLRPCDGAQLVRGFYEEIPTVLSVSLDAAGASVLVRRLALANGPDRGRENRNQQPEHFLGSQHADHRRRNRVPHPRSLQEQDISGRLHPWQITSSPSTRMDEAHTRESAVRGRHHVPESTRRRGLQAAHHLEQDRPDDGPANSGRTRGGENGCCPGTGRTQISDWFRYARADSEAVHASTTRHTTAPTSRADDGYSLDQFHALPGRGLCGWGKHWLHAREVEVAARQTLLPLRKVGPQALVQGNYRY